VIYMSRVKVTDDIELASEIRQGLKENNGYCPCKPVSDDTKCMCKEFREQDVGPCYCGLYVKEYVNE